MSNNSDSESIKFRPAELAQCARREVRFRRRVYPELVHKGSLDRNTSDREIAMMVCIAQHFESMDQPELL